MMRRIMVRAVLSLAMATVPVQGSQTQTQQPSSGAAPPAPAAGAQTPAAPAPSRIDRNARLFIEPSDFGKALAAAILKKKVPVIATTNRDRADFFMETTANASEEKTAERVTKVMVLGAFAGSGRRFDATVNITNRDGVIIFAHNSKKENFQSAAENVAKELKKHIEGK